MKSLLSSFPSLGNSTGTNSQHIANQYIQPGSSKYSQISPAIKVDGSATCRDRRASASSPLASLGFMYGSPLSDHSSQHSDSGIVSSDGVIDYSTSKPHEIAVYSRYVLALYALAKDPSPQIAKLGQKTLSVIGIEQVITKPLRLCGGSVRQGDSSPVPSPAGLARSYSWLDMYAGPSPLSFKTPPVSTPRQNFLKGLRRVCSLEFIPHQLNLPDSGLADPVFGSCVSFVSAEQRLLPQSTIYRWSCDYFSRPLLTAAEDSGELLIMREKRERFARDSILKCQHTSVGKLSSQIANWDTKFDRGTRTMLLLPFSPFIVAADQSERIRIWNYEEGTPVNSFENHDSPDKGISKLCLLNELDDSLLLVASVDGSIRIWKDFTLKDDQKLVTAFSSFKDRRPGMCNVNAVVDWQQQLGYLYASLETSIMLWDLDKEQLVNSIPSSSESCISALSASQVQGGQVAVGYDDGSVRLFDIRTPSMLMCTARPHVQKVERVVGIDFQPGLDLAKIVSASQAGDIQLLDTRYPTNSYLTIEAHRGSLTALAVHRHAPVIASGSDKQLVKVFSLEGGQLSTIRYSPTFMTQRSGSINCLTFHPYHVLLAAGASDACVSIYTEDNSFVFNDCK